MVISDTMGDVLCALFPLHCDPFYMIRFGNCNVLSCSEECGRGGWKFDQSACTECHATTRHEARRFQGMTKNKKDTRTETSKWQVTPQPYDQLVADTKNTGTGVS